ncbi:flagellar basal body-associated FliL family protein [Rheinheimera sp.]|uniref:flagellar basal body-associated FliL family protein n=1 Tax=Rheinheimera sp. TaxID=1869214 RepID=UPI003AF4CB14
MKKAVVFLLVLVAAGAAAAGYFWWQLNQGAAKTEEISVKPLFYPMEKFVMSVSGDPTSRYLVLELTLVSHKADTIAALKDATPLLRNALVEHFARQSHLEVKLAMQQVAEVQSELLARFNQTLLDNKYEQQLDKVLITNIFIQ